MTPRDVRPALDPSLTISGGRDLVAVVGRLVRERAWETLTALFGSLVGEGGMAPAALADLDAAARLVSDGLAALPPPKNPRGEQADELRALALAAAEALLARCTRPPLAEVERRALERAAGLLARGGDHRRAALTYEELGADERAAEAWGALGDLDRMEAALERDARQTAAHRAAGELLNRFEALLTGGDRRRALAAVAVASNIEEAASLRLRAAAVERRLCDGRAVTLRAPAGSWIRVAPLPVEIGRDPHAGLPLRDPAVSRRHAALRADGDDVVLVDLGSRTGVRLGGVRLEPGAALPLRGAGEIALGPVTVLRFEVRGGQVTLEGASGLDRGLRALVGPAPLPFAALIPGTEGLAVTTASEGVRLLRSPEVAARVDGHLIGAGCDLLHGDVVEVVGSEVRFEVE
ncbi:MAG TPA: FHA domain-containing protein [Polyangia bacterium]|nr:FHA domain-containing protein [Polyangia bacterium]